MANATPKPIKAIVEPSFVQALVGGHWIGPDRKPTQEEMDIATAIKPNYDLDPKKSYQIQTISNVETFTHDVPPGAENYQFNINRAQPGAPWSVTVVEV